MTKVIDPNIIVAISYNTIFDDCDHFDAASLINSISMYGALDFIAQRINSVNYSFGDKKKQRDLIYEMRCYFSDEPKILNKIDKFILENDDCSLYNNESFFIFEMMILQYADPSIDLLYNKDIQTIYKAYLFSSKIWLDMQASKLEKSTNLQEYSIRLDLPIVEFKTYKDFRVQLYKANLFFQFCERDELFKGFLKYFLDDNQYTNYVDYLSNLFILYHDSYSNLEIKDIAKYKNFFKNIKRFFISIDKCKSLFDNRDMAYIRGHFLYPIKEKMLVLNPNLLVDKFYQGILFDFWETVKNHKGKDMKGKEISDFGDFRSIIGMRFSECELFYKIISNSFNTKGYIMISGTEMKDIFMGEGLVGEPDYYIRKGNSIFLFEFKDLILAESLKKSNSFKNIKDAILAKICKDGENKRKGAIQILYNINRVYNKAITIEKSREVSPSDIFFPIVVTTDRCFDALGINSMIIQEFSQIAEKKYSHLAGRVKMPILINIDTFIDIMYRLHVGQIDFESLLLDYLSVFDEGLYSKKAMISFGNFVYDYYKTDSLTLREENRYLFGAFLEGIKQKKEKELN